MSPTSTEQTVVLRSPYRLVLTAGFLVVAGVTALLHVTVVPSESLLLSGYFALMALLSIAAWRWIALILKPDELVQRSLTVNRWAWSDIERVNEARNIATRYLTIDTTDRGQVQLRLPTVAFGTGEPRFEREVELINRYWLAHR